jgi:hypothetical protein
MAGYSTKALVVKLGIKKGARVAALGSPMAYEELVEGLPDGAKVASSLRGTVDFIHFFANSDSELRSMFPKLKKSLVENGTLWVSWPKGASKVATDLNENVVRKIGLEAGLVDVKVCAVNETWSGLKFVYRLKDRKGKAQDGALAAGGRRGLRKAPGLSGYRKSSH